MFRIATGRAACRPAQRLCPRRYLATKLEAGPAEKRPAGSLPAWTWLITPILAGGVYLAWDQEIKKREGNVSEISKVKGALTAAVHDQAEKGRQAAGQKAKQIEEHVQSIKGQAATKTAAVVAKAREVEAEAESKVKALVGKASEVKETSNVAKSASQKIDEAVQKAKSILSKDVEPPVESTSDTIKDFAGKAKDTLTKKASTAAQAVKSAAQDVSDHASKTLESVKTAADSSAKTLATKTKEVQAKASAAISSAKSLKPADAAQAAVTSASPEAKSTVAKAATAVTDKIATHTGTLGLTPLPEDTTVIFVLGGPGAGKGTQCANLVRDYNFVHLSAGDLLRAEQNRPGSEYGELINTYITEGKIVPMEITIALLHKAMKEAPQTRFLIDGFPRKMDQALKFEEEVCSGRGILYFECPEEEMLKRLMKRGETSGRADDNIESIKKRFETFRDTSYPVIQHYDKLNKVKTVSCLNSVENVYKGTKTVVEKLLNESGSP
ncbi:adenylate kinase-domain-containing protein [Phlyctochytrium arcticum]|nr:adenylate kinase-domain-containing protein [Phlyctochytrium arcticum]